MKIVLHAARFNSPFGLVCSLVTLSGYSHGSIIDNRAQRWGTTFGRGYFDKAPRDWYCFEALDRCLASVGIELDLGKAVSAKTILAALLERGYTATITRGRYYA